uniref:Uncharacterized protein n=1 Tax=Glossina austeni TaxID=7395 RepID=A0A1A9VB78_GLOAU
MIPYLYAEMIRRKRQKIAVRKSGKAHLSQNLINQRQMRTTCQGTSFLCTCNPSRVSGAFCRRTPHSTLHVGRLAVNLPSEVQRISGEEMLPSICHFDNLNYHRSLYDNRSNIPSVQFHSCLPKHLKVWSHSVDANEPRDEGNFLVDDNPPNTLSEQFPNYLSNCLEAQSHSVDVSGPPDEDHFLKLKHTAVIAKHATARPKRMETES